VGGSGAFSSSSGEIIAPKSFDALSLPGSGNTGGSTTDPTEFIQGRGVGILDCMSTSATSDVYAEGKDGGFAPYLCGLWVQQWRLRNIIVPTSAFAQISLAVHSLTNMDLREMKSLSDIGKIAFLMNLYNLLSLHASIMLPWPHVKDRAGRVRWQQAARYDIGGAPISLIHIEYMLIKSRLAVPKPPTIPGSQVSPHLCAMPF
jgi:hypothetical protein